MPGVAHIKRPASADQDDPPDTGPSTLRRYRDVTTVLIKHGLADVVGILKLGRYAALGTRILPPRARIDPSLSRAARFRHTLEELGPTFVKFGQALSVRSDLLPDEIIHELTRLQDQVAPLAPGQAEAVIETEFGRPTGELFRRFDTEPLASASIAQVHRAVLVSGEPVVVKVRRPGIGQTITADIEILRQLARLAERRFPGAETVNPTGLVEEFARTIRAELDFIREGHNVERCAASFEDDATVRLPRVYWTRTTSAVLTLEFLDGLKLSELDEAGVDQPTRRLIAQRGADAILAQVLVHGFFHADPHPGNLLVLDGSVIGFLDFGIVGHLDEPARMELARIIRAIWRRDARELTEVALDVAEPHADVNQRALQQDLAALMDTYGSLPLEAISAGELLGDVIRTAARHRLRLPSHLMLLIKALVTIEGVGLRLDPSFRIVEHAAPMAEQLWRSAYSPRAMSRRFQETMGRSLGALRTLPGHVDAIARKIRDGRLEVRFVHKNFDHFVLEMDRSSNRLAFALIIAALIVGSSLVVHAGRDAAGGYPTLGVAGFVVAGFFGIGLAIGIVRSGRL